MKKTCVFFATTLALMFLSACGAGEPLSKTEFLLDTVCTVTVYSKSDEKAAEDALALCKDLENMFSRAVSGSGVSQINGAGGGVVSISQDMSDLLEKAVHYGDLSGGLFDVTIGAVSSMWDFSPENAVHKVPSKSELTAALSSVNYHNIEIAPGVVSLDDPAALLDLGGIAKGYIADRMADLLSERGVKSAVIDLGGNVVTVGKKSGGKPWNIGVRNPFSQRDGDGETSAILGTIRVDGSVSVGTSGTYERYFEQGGAIYHHILDPGTGYPADTDLAGVTVVTDLSVDGEGFSTTCILLGSERAKVFLEENHIPAVLVREDGSVITTSGIDYTPAAAEWGKQ